jgi:hypothetical protein
MEKPPRKPRTKKPIPKPEFKIVSATPDKPIVVKFD